MNVLSPVPTDHSQTPPAFRRSLAVPTKSAASPKLSSASAGEAVEQAAETLYAHNAGKIVSFNPPTSGTRRHSSVEQGYSALQDEPVGTLPWASATERTLAAGPFRIYRVLGSVAFLNSGNRFLKPVLAKSQCWCVDGESKFVLQAGPHTYYRIELPNTSAEDRNKVEEFKSTVGKILQYETTSCPFKRGFTVELPEKPQTPVRKKPWRPRERPPPTLLKERPERPSRTLRDWERSSTLIEARCTASLPSEQEVGGTSAEYTDLVPENNVGSSETGQDTETIDDSEITPRNPTSQARQEFDPYKTPTRPRTLKTGRAATAPPLLSLPADPSSDSASEDIHPPDALDDESSLSSSLDSFHSFHSPISPLPSSPAFAQHSSSPRFIDDEGITVLKVRNHRRDDSELTVTADSEDIWTDSKPPLLPEAAEPISPELPHTPMLIHDTASQSEEPSPEAITPSSIQLRRRTKHSRQRSHSPLPSPANLYSPSSRLSRHHLTVLQKTCSMLLSPPISLVALMLNIASRIMSGTYSGFPFSHNPGRKIPCSWESSDTDQPTEEEKEDDYGCALQELPSSRSSSRSRGLGGSWEID
ncbi:MAG: hypothetical protein Q9208_001719 [Pyrenodesmia sp. 3 TL-2023]